MHRRVSLLPAVAATALTLGACGGGGEPTVEMRSAATSTTFVTLPPPPSTTAPPPTSAPAASSAGADAEPDGPDEEAGTPVDPVTGNRTYEVQRNDYLMRIATQFDVTPQEIADANGWPNIQHNINPGDEILIPPADGAEPDGAEADGAGAGTQPEDGATESTDAATDECEDGSEPETYELQSGDIPARVAQQFNVTVAELREANADTPNYRNFIVGTEINIPC